MRHYYNLEYKRAHANFEADTSPLVRDELEKKDGEKVAMKDPPNLLYRQKCLNALVSFRHAKWFQARANGLKSCVIVLHILCDLCNRVPT